MCSRHLAAAARRADDYLDVYGAADRRGRRAGRPALARARCSTRRWRGYWGATDLDARRPTPSLGADRGARRPRSTASRCRCWTRSARWPCAAGCRPGCACYTGDDFNYPALIRGRRRTATPTRCSASSPRSRRRPRPRCARWTTGDLAAYDRILDPTVPLARHLFGAPTCFYKTGIVFLAWLAGHQDHFTMVGGAAERTLAARTSAALLRTGRRRRAVAGRRAGRAPRARAFCRHGRESTRR